MALAGCLFFLLLELLSFLNSFFMLILRLMHICYEDFSTASVFVTLGVRVMKFVVTAGGQLKCLNISERFWHSSYLRPSGHLGGIFVP